MRVRKKERKRERRCGIGSQRNRIRYIQFVGWVIHNTTKVGDSSSSSNSKLIVIIVS